jgi:hypothetical protein
MYVRCGNAVRGQSGKEGRRPAFLDEKITRALIAIAQLKKAEVALQAV